MGEQSNGTGNGMGICYTYGYQNKRVGELERLVERNHIRLIADVRERPYSARPEFRQETLRGRVAGYEHIGALGNSGRLDNGDGRWKPASQPEAQEALVQISLRLHAGESVLLLCVEPQAQQCHRGEIAKRLRGMTGCEVRHLC